MQNSYRSYPGRGLLPHFRQDLLVPRLQKGHSYCISQASTLLTLGRRTSTHCYRGPRRAPNRWSCPSAPAVSLGIYDQEGTSLSTYQSSCGVSVLGRRHTQRQGVCKDAAAETGCGTECVRLRRGCTLCITVVDSRPERLSRHCRLRDMLCALCIGLHWRLSQCSFQHAIATQHTRHRCELK